MRPPRSEAEPRDAIRPRIRERRAAVDDPQVVLDAALRFLETRSRSVHEVRRRLVMAGYRPGLVEGAIVRLLDIGILDDAVFARAWIESRDRARPRGEHALRRELTLKGVDRSLIDELLDERRDAAASGDGATAGGAAGSAGFGGVSGATGTDGVRTADAAAAERLLARHARALGRVSDPRLRRQRAYALLARNGFDPDTCSTAAAALVAASDDLDDAG